MFNLTRSKIHKPANSRLPPHHLPGKTPTISPMRRSCRRPPWHWVHVEAVLVPPLPPRSVLAPSPTVSSSGEGTSCSLCSHEIWPLHPSAKPHGRSPRMPVRRANWINSTNPVVFSLPNLPYPSFIILCVSVFLATKMGWYNIFIYLLFGCNSDSPISDCLFVDFFELMSKLTANHSQSSSVSSNYHNQVTIVSVCGKQVSAFEVASYKEAL